jgi:hypothetical protein
MACIKKYQFLSNLKNANYENFFSFKKCHHNIKWCELICAGLVNFLDAVFSTLGNTKLLCSLGTAGYTELMSANA